MTPLPANVHRAWEDRDGQPAVLATVGTGGAPNLIYVTCVGLFGEDQVVVADNYFSKTRANILAGSKGALLFRSKDGTSYQIKGRFQYHTEGEVFDDMKKWNLPGKPGNAAAALSIEEVYSGATRLL
jgi:uncharacterized protein